MDDGYGYFVPERPSSAGGNSFHHPCHSSGKIAGGKQPALYKNLHTYNGDEVAKEFNLISKQSAEKLSAQMADSFTTVSEITATGMQPVSAKGCGCGHTKRL